MGLNDLLKGVNTVAIVCNQWGDTGKGKFSDFFASQWADVTARGTGGNNAGHTAVVNGREKIFHLIPAGISNDSLGKTTILGNGMVIDMSALSQELDELDREGSTYNNLMVSRDAHVIMPYHIHRDRIKDQSQKGGGIGSTGRGIGPAYTDKIARRGIRIADLLDRDTLAKKINKVKEAYPEQRIDTDDLIDRLRDYTERVKPLVRDTVSEVHNFMRAGKKILIEGAQGLFLSIEHGTYPYVTSSDCSLNGTASGVGISAKMIDLPFGVVKFPFMTRVGGGPFPTEFGGSVQEEYCAEEGHRKVDELKKYGIQFVEREGRIVYDRRDPKIIALLNSEDDFIQGIGVRLTAGEYGATTGRPRRTGWTDAVMGRYATSINGPFMILTKADSLSDVGEFKISYGYEESGRAIEELPKDERDLRNAKPVYRRYPGYGDISSVRDFSRLPRSLREAVEDFERFTRGKVSIVSVGADREETIVR